jgi:hypothetical protein
VSWKIVHSNRTFVWALPMLTQLPDKTPLWSAGPDRAGGVVPNGPTEQTSLRRFHIAGVDLRDVGAQVMS